jgi:hypothetical protein
MPVYGRPAETLFARADSQNVALTQTEERTVTYALWFLIFGCGVFAGFILAAFFTVGARG